MHIPVLQKEVLEYLNPKPNENFVDCTIGEGGHTVAILEKNGPEGKVLGIEIDPELYEKTKSKFLIPNSQFLNRLILVNNSFKNLKEIVRENNFQPDGVLIDLGFCDWHIEQSKRGFSFQRNEKLDMRYNPEAKDLTAEKIINNWPEEKIATILEEYSQERFAKKIAKQLIKERMIKPIENTFQLVDIIKKSIPSRYHHQKIHFATRTFQALRIIVNGELENLKEALPQTLEVLKPLGRIAIISFHSLEDRIIKNFLKDKAKEGLLKILTKKPIRPTVEEIKVNHRSRSAKLRVVQKLSQTI
jgi:16S rRNA (cytosine1402-N4)-methyltransferase